MLKNFFENIKQTINLSKLYRETKIALEYAIDTSRAVNAAIDVVHGIKHYVDHPEDFLAQNRARFEQAYPDIGEISYQVGTLKNSVGTWPEKRKFNPYALQDLFGHLQNTKQNVYEIIARVSDKNGISSVHDSIRKELKQQKGQSDEIFDNFEKLNKLGAATPQKAAVFQARAAVQTARATINMAMNINELTRMRKDEYLKKIQDEENSKSLLRREIEGTKKLIPKSLALTPWSPN